MERLQKLIILSLLLLPYAVIYSVAQCRSNCSTNGISDTNDQNSQCPMWTTPGNNKSCICGRSSHWLLLCIYQSKSPAVTLPLCYCMSHNELFNTTVIGYCIARCHIQVENPARKSIPFENQRYKILVNNSLKLNDTESNRALCSDLKMNRVGQMCGRCDDGYAPPVYSYSLNCVKCSNYRFNWLKYIAAAYIPLTVFYLLVILFRTSATSSRLNGYITTCQLLTSPTLLRYITVTLFNNSGNTHSTIIVSKLVFTWYSIWNLDFFRLVYTPFCIHPKMSTLETLALDYIIAVYPLLLVILTWVMVTLHDHYTVIMRLWRPFHRCFAFFRREWDLRTSLVSAFATFILLSYIKTLNISLDLLTPLTLYDINEKTLTKRYLGVDGTVIYFGTQLLPYALLALVMCSLFNIFPLLLLSLWSCRCFHSCMNRCRLHSQVLHTFMDVFHGSFKTHPRDYRLFAAFYILLRVVNLIILAFAGCVLYFPLAAIVMGIAANVFAIVKPHKSSGANYIDTILFSLLALAFYYFPMNQYVQNNTQDVYHLVLNTTTITLLSFHFLYGIAVFIIAFQPRMLRTLLSFIYQSWIRSMWNSTPPELRLPHRLEHPDHPAYAPLITGTEQMNRYT